MKRLLSIVLLGLLLGACAPATLMPVANKGCADDVAAEVGNLWLQQEGEWRLRQSVLLEIAWKKFAIDGYLQVDPVAAKARLVGLNEMGILLFDLSLSRTQSSFSRAIPQLAEHPELAELIADSIRKLFFHAEELAALEMQLPAERSLSSADKSKRYSFDCAGRLSQILSTDDGWTAEYNDYKDFGGSAIPQKIELSDSAKRLRLQLWTREIKEN